MAERPYHHGALRPALLEAAEQLLERDGPDHLSMRAVARAACVSHAAPVHHFGDLRGLLTALAAIGFQRFTAALEAASASPQDALQALGRAYVQFARAHPGLFLLMFRSQLLDSGQADLRAAMEDAFTTLARVAATEATADDGEHGRALASWCLVHGFAMLLLDGRLPPNTDPDDLLESVLAGP